VAMALRERPDAVLLDMRVPGMDGLAAARAMRSGGYHGTIIALTGLGGEMAHALRDAGCDLHIVKPVRTATLHGALAGRLPLD
jgi:CheY-like chemotaxis protein